MATAIPYATAIVVLVVIADFIMVEPAKASGIVEQFSLRTTVLAP